MRRRLGGEVRGVAPQHLRSSSLDGLRGDAPCLILLGMRGAGKTTLGRLAAEHLDAPFVDADERFAQMHNATPKEFVAQHGWPAFRSEETAILRELLGEMTAKTRTKPLVVSLGGGVVEEETNRELIKASWSSQDGRLDRSKRIAVIHVFREMDKVLLDQRGLPSWTGVSSGDEVWNRRRPWFRESSSHEFVNFTDGDVLQHASQAETSRAARLRFEAVERDFVRFLLALLESYEPRAQLWIPSYGTRSYLVTLPFEDLRPHVAKLPLITLGADAIELRADLLHDLSKAATHGVASSDVVEAYENPSLSYLSEQVALIRRHLPGYPLVFTLRTPAQGGRYPYPADAPAEALFTSLRHALKLGCNVIDIEMGLDALQTRLLVREAKERRIAVLVSWRDKVASTKGGFAWQADKALQLYDSAVAMGADVVKIVGTAGQVSDNFALRLFAADLQAGQSAAAQLPPLSAYNMGYAGRISRFLNPVLASVTHALAKELSKRGVVGNPSMTFAEVQQALHLSGLIEKASFVAINCDEPAVSLLQGYTRWFGIMGLPYSIRADTLPVQDIAKLLRDNDPRKGDVRGVLFNDDGVMLDDMERWKGVEVTCDDGVVDSGYADCALVETKVGTATGTETPMRTFRLRAANKIVDALAELITGSISPSVHLNRQSVCVVLDDLPNADSRHSMSVDSAIQAARAVGLEIVTRHVVNERWESPRGDPTVIINCCSDATLQTSLLNSANGGLYIDMYESKLALACVQQPCYAEVGWRCIQASAVWRHVHALRFRAFTGRRAPSGFDDADWPGAR